MDTLSQNQIHNYTLISKVGEGASSEVILAKKNIDKTLCVIKMIRKISQNNQTEQKYALQQRQLLSAISHPFIVKMDQAFQTTTHFCLALEYCPGGDLYNHLHSTQPFNEQKITFYAAQLILALEYLHSQKIIYRDLKPENILIGKDGYLKLTDFGLSSRLMTSKVENANSSVCGTSQYTSPQVLKGHGDGKAFDWWTLGCCLYELLYQISPFYSDDKENMKENILKRDPVFLGKTSSTLRDLIRKLLTKDPSKRLELINDIKNHSFFTEINFSKLISKQYPMPYVPQYKRGKKMLKVIKKDVQMYKKFGEGKTPETSYVSGFDYNCEGMEEKAVSSEDEIEKTEKLSTEDEDDQSYKNVFETESKTISKQLLQTL